MESRETLKNRIRGWFPQDSVVVTSKVKVKAERQQPPPTIPANYTMSATKASWVTSVLCIGFFGYMAFNFLKIAEYFPISMLQASAFVLVGLAAGAVSCIVWTKNKLKQLKIYCTSPMNGKDLALPMALIGVLLVSSSFGSFMLQISIYSAFLVSTLAFGVTYAVITPIMYAAFERKQNMRIMRGGFYADLALIPKAPYSNNHSQ